MALSAVTLGFLLPSRRRSSAGAEEAELSVAAQEAHYEKQDREDEIREEMKERRRLTEERSLSDRRSRSARRTRGNGANEHRDEGTPRSPSDVNLAQSAEAEQRGVLSVEAEAKDVDLAEKGIEDTSKASSPSAQRTGLALPRTVTIAQDPPRVHRPLPLASTSKSDSRSEQTPHVFPPRSRPGWFTRRRVFRSLDEDWRYRHDPGHQGFWRRVLKGITGAKEVEDDVRGPDWVPPSYRWTPILSGLIVPFSILLEIPGLTEHWYVRTEGNVAVEYQANPIILDVGLAISMACALVANVALISRFMERRVFKATVLAIAALTCHDLINIIAVTIFGVVHRFDDGFTYAEAFWLTVCSSVASIFTNLTLITDLVRTPNFRLAGSGLTPKQRSLVIAVMVLLAYIAFGALVYNLMDDKLSFQDALYFTVVSIETIGFGDAKIFFFFYETVGVLNLAVAVGTARDTLLESWENAYRRRQKRLQHKHAERKKQRALEKTRNRIIERKLTEAGAPVYVDTKHRGAGRGGRGAAGDRGGLNVSALTDFDMEMVEREAEAEMEDGQLALTETHGGASGLTRRDQALSDMRSLQDDLSSQSSASEDGYKVFLAQIALEEKREGVVKFGFAFGLFLMFWILGSVIFQQTEGWSYFVSLYFCYVSFTTVGFGDYYPTTPAGRAFFIVWAIFGVATLTLLFAVLGEAYERGYKNAVHKKGVNRAIKNIRKNSQDLRVSRTSTMSSSLSRSATLASTYTAEDPEKDEDAEASTQVLTMEPEIMEPAEIHHEILEAAKGFHEHITYFVHHSSGEPSAALTRALHEMADEHSMTDLEREEVLGDQDARRVLFMMSYEHRLLSLISALETAMSRDADTPSGSGAVEQVETQPPDLPEIVL